MDTGHRLIAQAAMKLACEMPAAYVEALAQAIQSGAPNKAQAVQGIPHLHYRALAGDFVDLWQEQVSGLPAEAVALALRTALHAEQKHRSEQVTELVWTGPSSEAHPFRRTEQAVLQVLDSARQRITLVSYAVYRIPNVCQALVGAARRGVQINVIVETPDKLEGENEYNTIRALGDDVAGCSAVYFWPKEKRGQDDKGRIGILHERSRKKDKPLVLHFNPWWFSGQDRLLQAFLQQLGAAVNRIEKDKPVKKASGLLGKLSTALKLVSLIPVIGKYAKMAQEAAASASEVTKQYAEALAADLQQIRKEIDDLLSQLPHRIVIIMDDIDRLTAGEIGQLFAILKAVADFPNTVYILAYDERVVRRAIHSTLGISGKTYLEKIVQLPIDLPTPDRTTLYQLFLEQLQELLGEQDDSPTVQTDFGNIFHDGLKHFLVTPRACKRLMNVLRFTLPPLRGEVYWPDMVGVACLIAFAPQVVRTLTAHAGHFIGQSGREDRKDAERFHKRWLGQVDAKDRSAVEGIVRRLFPRADAALGGSMYGSDWEPRWRIQLRVRSEAHFDKYFRLSVPTGAISETEWQDCIELLSSHEAFKQRLLETCGRTGRQGTFSQAREALDRLKDFVKLQATPTQATQVFLAVMEVGDELAEVQDKEMAGGIFPITNKLRICWLAQDALEKIDSPTERVQLIRHALDQAVGLHTAVELVKVLGYEHGMYGSSGEGRSLPAPPLVPKQNVEEFAGAIPSKIETAAADGSLAKCASFMEIVRHWRLFGHEDNAVEWVRQFATSDENLTKIIRQLRGEIRSQSVTDRVMTAMTHVDCNYLGTFISVLAVRQRCANLLATTPGWLTSEDRDSLKAVVASIGVDGRSTTNGENDGQDSRKRKAELPSSLRREAERCRTPMPRDSGRGFGNAPTSRKEA